MGCLYVVSSTLLAGCFSLAKTSHHSRNKGRLEMKFLAEAIQGISSVVMQAGDTKVTKHKVAYTQTSFSGMKFPDCRGGEEPRLLFFEGL